jgi:hypothetical protein
VLGESAGERVRCRVKERERRECQKSAKVGVCRKECVSSENAPSVKENACG